MNGSMKVKNEGRGDEKTQKTNLECICPEPNKAKTSGSG